MKKIVNFLFLSGLILLAFSCTKEYMDWDFDNEHIKSVSMSGKTVHKYLYDPTGKIVEENCMYYYKQYFYDENNRLVKVESSIDWSVLFSSIAMPARTEFMTSQNSTANGYNLYKYDDKGRLSKIENYSNMTGEDFEYRSTQTFEYNGAHIVKENLHDSEGKITQYYVYTYDNRGNVSCEKYFVNLFSPNELYWEISYKYDNYKNPFHIFNKLGSPGLYTNVNNIVETSFTSYSDSPGIDKYANSKQTYLYNKNGYPVKLITEDSEEDYKY